MNSVDKTADESISGVEDINMYVEKGKIKAYDFVKRGIDIIAGIIGCIALIPLTIVIKVLNIINKDYGSVFLVQKRIGKNGKTFKLYKFRSMVVGANKMLKKMLDEDEELRKEYEVNKKLKNDPRVTKVGKFIRKTSIDEIPQFVNILKGDMSLVGNRPYLLREKKEMGMYYKDIVKTKPGLTGLWQTSGRSDVTFKERLKIESEYSNKYSLKMDLKIVLKTCEDVICRRGAI